MKAGRSITIQELAEVSAQEALDYDKEFPVTAPDTELEYLATPPEAEPTLAVILNNSLKSGMSVEAMQGLYSLYEKDQRAKAEAALSAALAKFKRICPKITRNREGYQKRKDGTPVMYADLSHTLEKAGPALTECDLSVSWQPVNGDGWMEGDCIISHSSGASVTRRSSRFPLKKDADAGEVLRVEGYVRRSSFNNAAGMTSVDEEDDSAAPDPITADQVAILEGYLSETGDADGWRPRLLKWARVATVAAIPAAMYDEAVARAKAKKGQRAT